jgi:multicomponent Na+:H+ antiporter subunit C
MSGLYAITAGLLFGVALFGVLTRRGLIQRLLAANVMAHAVFLYLIVAAGGGARAALDPVPQAMVLTGIVIAVSVTAFALGLVRWFRHATGQAAVEDARSPDSEMQPRGDELTVAEDTGRNGRSER